MAVILSELEKLEAENCTTCHNALTKLVEYRYNSVEIDVQLCKQFLYLDATIQETWSLNYLRTATVYRGRVILINTRSSFFSGHSEGGFENFLFLYVLSEEEIKGIPEVQVYATRSA